MKKRIVAALVLLGMAGALFAAGRRESTATPSGGKAPMEFVIGNGTEIQSIDPTQIEGVPEHRV
ncbi:MAG: peptide ABC transporter substrate-binding protein, partial [Treponema sp.]|nr:peptide ABC transporter substrate-binding protein [Treponema sp.]